MTDEPEQSKSWLKGALSIGGSLIKGLLIPITAGLLMWCFTYPVGVWSCRNYSNGLSLQDWRYSFFVCFVRQDDKWFTKEQYEASQIGVKLILSPDIKVTK